MQQLTTIELKEKIKNKENFILDLFATWCGPCKVMLGNLERVGESIGGGDLSDFNIYKYDIDSDREFVVTELNIRSVPTIKIFKKGDEVFSKVGVMSSNEIINELMKV